MIRHSETRDSVSVGACLRSGTSWYADCVERSSEESIMVMTEAAPDRVLVALHRARLLLRKRLANFMSEAAGGDRILNDQPTGVSR